LAHGFSTSLDAVSTASTPVPAPSSEPPVSTKVFGAIVIVRFNVAPNVESARLIIDVTREALTRATKISFVGIVPDRMQVPTPEFRKVLADQGPTIRHGARSVHFAIEGSGVFASIQRAMLSTIAAVVSGEVPFSIHRSGEDALREISRLGFPLEDEVISRAVRLGLIRPAAP
jgi:hypothetical protein